MGAPQHVDCSLGFVEMTFFPVSEQDPALEEILKAGSEGKIKVEWPLNIPHITQAGGKEVRREMRHAAVCDGYYSTKELLDENFPRWQDRGVHLSEEGIVLNLHHAPYCAGCSYNNIRVGVEKK